MAAGLPGLVCTSCNHTDLAPRSGQCNEASHARTVILREDVRAEINDIAAIIGFVDRVCESDWLPYAWTDRLSETFEDLELQFPDIGYCPHWEDPDRSAEEIETRHSSNDSRQRRPTLRRRGSSVVLDSSEHLPDNDETVNLAVEAYSRAISDAFGRGCRGLGHSHAHQQRTASNPPLHFGCSAVKLQIVVRTLSGQTLRAITTLSLSIVMLIGPSGAQEAADRPSM